MDNKCFFSAHAVDEGIRLRYLHTGDQTALSFTIKIKLNTTLLWHLNAPDAAQGFPG